MYGIYQWFPSSFDGGQSLTFKISWRATEIRGAVLSCFHCGRMRALERQQIGLWGSVVSFPMRSIW